MVKEIDLPFLFQCDKRWAIYKQLIYIFIVEKKGGAVLGHWVQFYIFVSSFLTQTVYNNGVQLVWIGNIGNMTSIMVKPLKHGFVWLRCVCQLLNSISKFAFSSELESNLCSSEEIGKVPVFPFMLDWNVSFSFRA